MKMEKEFAPSCDYIHAHDDIVKKVKDAIPGEEMLFELSELYKIFGDSTRIKILYVLFESEMCVCDIGELLGMTKAAISHQLRILRQSKLVKARKCGKEVFYSLADEHVKKIFEMAIEHVCE